MMSAEETPALAISVMASAASVAEKAVSAPAFIAASRNCSSFAPEAPVAAEMADIDFSNSIDLPTAIPRPATIAPPMMRAPLPARSKCLEAVACDVFADSPSRIVAADAWDIPATYCPISALSWTATVRFATLPPSIRQKVEVPIGTKGR
jgi:hypothetical protein